MSEPIVVNNTIEWNDRVSLGYNIPVENGYYYQVTLKLDGEELTFEDVGFVDEEDGQEGIYFSNSEVNATLEVSFYRNADDSSTTFFAVVPEGSTLEIIGLVKLGAMGYKIENLSLKANEPVILGYSLGLVEGETYNLAAGSNTSDMVGGVATCKYDSTHKVAYISVSLYAGSYNIRIYDKVSSWPDYGDGSLVLDENNAVVVALEDCVLTGFPYIVKA